VCVCLAFHQGLHCSGFLYIVPIQLNDHASQPWTLSRLDLFPLQVCGDDELGLSKAACQNISLPLLIEGVKGVKGAMDTHAKCCS